MKELKKFVEDVLKKREGFELGSPWKFSENSMGVVVPIIRGGEHTRDYVTLPEIKDKVKFEDLGGITPIGIKHTDGLPLFIRSGTMLEGIKGQDRAVIHSVVLEPNIDEKVDVRCIHASRPTARGGGFNYAGYAPKTVHRNLKRGQSRTWGSVQGFYAMSSIHLSPEIPVEERRAVRNLGAVKHDDLPKIRKAQMKLDKNLQDILKEVPCFENQIGAIIVGMKGVVGVEAFDSPASWKSQYKDAIANYSDELAEKAKKSLFKFDDAEVMNVIKEFLKSMADAVAEPINDCSCLIKLKGYTGEVVTNLGHVIHIFLMESDNESDDEESFPGGRRQESFPSVATSLVGGVVPTTRSSNLKQRSFLCDVRMTKGIKKGYNEIAQSINKHEGATWSEIEDDLKGSGISTATISTRLKEGRKDDIIGLDIRQKNGKRIYKMKMCE